MFIKLQQDIIDQELQEMPAKEINEILSTMKAEEAFDFLERIGRLRAWLVYTWGYAMSDRCGDILEQSVQIAALVGSPEKINRVGKGRRTLCEGGCGRRIWDDYCRKCSRKIALRARKKRGRESHICQSIMEHG